VGGKCANSVYLEELSMDLRKGKVRIRTLAFNVRDIGIRKKCHSFGSNPASLIVRRYFGDQVQSSVIADIRK
jgi:hypothetical protein